jgi:hypothetical protein
VLHKLPVWNYKSAIISALCRAPLFFVTNLPAGVEAAAGAMGAEFVFRFVAAGFYGALTQAFRRVEPPLAGTVSALVVLPLLGHSVEFLVHWLRGTPYLGASIAASMVFTVVTTTFNLFAMRRGALIIGQGSRSLWHDLSRMPALIAAFVLSGVVSWRSRRFI